jgi:hypothetical protein
VNAFWGETDFSSADQFRATIENWPAQPGPDHPHVHVNPDSSRHSVFMWAEPAIGMAPFSARAVLRGRGRDIWEMVFLDEASSSRCGSMVRFIDLPRGMRKAVARPF